MLHVFLKTDSLAHANKEIEEVDRGKFKVIINTEYHTGHVDIASRGSGYIICDDFNDDVFIAFLLGLLT